MMDKIAFADVGISRGGDTGIYLLRPEGEKVASEDMVSPAAEEFLAAVEPEEDVRYLLVNAMGSHECWGPNSNNDAWPEAGLCYLPPGWSGTPARDRDLAKSWPYGLPTFYNGHAFCFPGSTEVVLADRRRVPIHTLQAGDSVATEEGPRRVLRVWKRRFSGAGVRLLGRGLRSPLVATGNHPFLVYRREDVLCPHRYYRHNGTGGCKRCPKGVVGEPRWVDAETIRVGDFLLVPRPPAGTVSTDPNFAEMVGWVASDGHLSSDGMVSFTLARPEKLRRVEECFRRAGYALKACPLKTQKATRLWVSSRELCSRLQEYVQGTLREKRLTEQVLLWDGLSLQRMLSAFVDGDGHVGRRTGQVRIRTASVQMMGSLLDALRALGVPATSSWDGKPGFILSPTNGKRYETGGSGCVEIPASWAREAFPFSEKVLRLGKTCTSHRWLSQDGFFLIPVTDVSEVPLQEDVFNLEVEGTHTYIAGEVLVHNCHHVNKDPAKKAGDIVYVGWNDHMKRVELVLKVERKLLQANNGADFWTMIERGDFPAVSMGSRVPWDRCFPAGTLVRAEGGHRPIESLKVGERVLTHEGRLRPITRAMSRTATVRLLDVVGLPVLRVTDEHPLFVIRKGGVRACLGSSRGMKPGHRFDRGSSVCRRCGKAVELTPKWVEAKDVAEGDYVASLVGREGPAQATHLPPFLVGAWLGDGFCIRSTKDSNVEGISFSFGKRKEGVLRQVEAELAEMGLVPRVYDRDTSWVVNAYSQPLAEELEGKFGRGSSGKRLPDEAFFWPDPAKRALLEGYIQTDGHTDEGGIVRIASINRGLLLDFRELLLSLGIPATLQKQPTRVSGFASVAPVFHLRFDWATTAPRAHGFFHGSYYFSPVASNKGEAADTEVFNLSVEEDESYIAEGLVTHNCSKCTDLDEFFHALSTFRAAEHPHPGIAVLRYHERMLRERGRGIRGIARKPAEYCDCMRYRAGQIVSGGIRIFVFNDFPRFFDQSLVRRGADKTAYTMVVVGRRGRSKVAMTVSGHSLADAMGKFRGPAGSLDQVFHHSSGGSSLADAERLYGSNFTLIEPKLAGAWVERPTTEAHIKIAEAEEEERREGAEKLAKEASSRKRAELQKDVEGVVQRVSGGESDLPKDVLDGLSGCPLSDALGSAAALGVVLRPREFLRVCLGKLSPGSEGLSDHLHLPAAPPQPPMPLRLLASLLPLLLPHLSERSGFDAPLRQRIMVIQVGSPKHASSTSPLGPVLETALPEDFLPKLAAMYGAYRAGLMEYLPHAQDDLAAADPTQKVAHLHAPPPEDLFTHLSYGYFQKAFMHELSR